MRNEVFPYSFQKDATKEERRQIPEDPLFWTPAPNIILTLDTRYRCHVRCQHYPGCCDWWYATSVPSLHLTMASSRVPGRITDTLLQAGPRMIRQRRMLPTTKFCPLEDRRRETEQAGDRTSECAARGGMLIGSDGVSLAWHTERGSVPL